MTKNNLIENDKNSNDDETRKRRKKRFIITLVSLLVVVVLAFISASLVKEYVITTFTVDGISMFPTLDGGGGAVNDSSRSNGERLVLNRVSKISRGDIIVFRPDWDIDAKVLVKRVIALAGDHLQIVDNVVYLNGAVLAEKYLNEQMSTPDLDIYISENSMFCMGDNRNRSTDCRVLGEVSLDTVIGKCFLIKGMDGKFRVPNPKT